MPPAAFTHSRDILASFPDDEAFAAMAAGVRYATFHLKEIARTMRWRRR
jgi:hypothetical protein